jgi:hypothetical protein
LTIALTARISRLAYSGSELIMKVIVQEAIAFGVAFAISLAISVAVVELIRGLI